MVEFSKTGQGLCDVYRGEKYLGSINNYRGVFLFSQMSLCADLSSTELRQISYKLDELNHAN